MIVYIPVLIETREGKTERSILAPSSTKALAEGRISSKLQEDLPPADERGFEVWESEVDGKLIYKRYYDGNGVEVTNVV